MKIALIAPDVFPCPPKSYGGAELVVHNLRWRLPQLGHEVTLYAKAGSWQDPVSRLVEVESATEALTEDLLGFDVIHWHAWQAGDLWAFAAAHPDHHFVQTWHGPSMGYTAPPPNVTVCGVSHWHAWSLSAELGVQCVVVPNGIHLEDYPLFEGPREPYLVSLNRLDPAKGIDRAIAMAKQAGMPLRIAGPEHGVPSQEYVQAILSRCDGLQVTYEGNLGLPEKVDLLQHATALLWLGGWEEPFGLGMVEANACGTPVLALARGATREVLRPVASVDGDRYCAGGLVAANETELTRRLHNLLHGRGNPTRPIAASACRANAERYSDRKMAESYLEVYQDAARRSDRA